MSGVDHRAPGLAVAALTDDAAYTELIADGVHVHPALWPLIARLKPVDRLLLVSDAIPLAGMGDGRARVGGLEVEVVGQRVTLVGTSTLAGSVIALDDAVRNLVGAGIALPAAVAAASRNPLAMLGVTDRGRIAIGQRADLVELDDALRCPASHAWRGLVRRRGRLTWSDVRAWRSVPSRMTSSTTRLPCSRTATASSGRPSPACRRSMRMSPRPGPRSRPLPPRTEPPAPWQSAAARSSATWSAPLEPPAGARTSGSKAPVMRSPSPRSIRDLYGFAAARWVDEGATNHYAVVPATDAALVDAWFRSGFGQQHVHAIRAAAAPDDVLRTPDGVVIRRAERRDIPMLGRLELVLGEHQVLSPVFSRVGPPTLEDATNEWEEGFDDPQFTTFVAEHDGLVVGSAVGCAIEESSEHHGIVRPNERGIPRLRCGRARGARPGRRAGAG